MRPDDAIKPVAAIINAARYQGTRPEGIAVCAAPQDAAACVSWAREHGVPFAVRSGGHSNAGFSTSDGLVIDVKGMCAVSVDPARGMVTVAGGTTKPDFGDALAPYGVHSARAFVAATTPTGTYGIKTGFVTGTLAADGIVTMLKWIGGIPGVASRAQESTAGLYCWGGKVNDLVPDANAFVHRSADLLFKCEALWQPEDDPDLIAANLDWLEGYHAAMQPYLSGGAYQSFTDRAQPDWETAYYGTNFERLVEMKQRWDPGNPFRFGQSIPVSL